MTNLPKIKRPPSLSSIAYTALRESILSFHFKQNIVYNEIAVAEGLGLSRTPVREALLKLASLGMITFLPRRGFVVSAYDLQDVEEVFELREIIETAIARKIVNTVTANDIETFENHIETQRKAAVARDRHSFMLSDRDFHFFYYTLADNNRLVKTTDNFQDLCHLMGANAFKNEGNYDRNIAEHEVIVKALQSGKTEKVEKAVFQHLSHVKETVKKTLEL